MTPKVATITARRVTIIATVADRRPHGRLLMVADRTVAGHSAIAPLLAPLALRLSALVIPAMERTLTAMATASDANDPTLFLIAIQIVAAGTAFTCTPVSVWDGDGPIWCAEGPHVRLAGIAAREIDDSCRDYHPCPSKSGVAARDELVRRLGGSTGVGANGHILVRGPTLRCQSDGNAKGTRTAAWCVSAQTGDLNCAMVRSGYALRWPKFWRNHRCP